jgi:hypothetical protein
MQCILRKITDHVSNATELKSVPRRSSGTASVRYRMRALVPVCVAILRNSRISQLHSRSVQKNSSCMIHGSWTRERLTEAGRDKMACLDSKAPLRFIKGVQFGLLDPDEIVSAYLKCSVRYLVWLNLNIWWLLLIVDSGRWTMPVLRWYRFCCKWPRNKDFFFCVKLRKTNLLHVFPHKNG